MTELEQLITRLPKPEPSARLDAKIAVLLQSMARRTTWRRWSWLAGAATAATIALLFWSHALEPDRTWAQVVAVVREKPWIHFKTKDGSIEQWISYPRDLGATRIATRDGDHVWFIDHRSGTKLEYFPERKTLFRLPLDEHETDFYRSLSDLFHAIFRGEERLGERFAGGWIVEQKQRCVEDNGRKWIERELQLRRGDQSESLVIRADGDTRLPVWMTIVAPQETTRYEFDYPREGPVDVYSLGVPRDAPVDDRTPPAGLAEIIHSLNENRRDLDNYFAVVGSGLANRLVWRKGEKWRVEMPVDTLEIKELLADKASVGHWSQERLAKIATLPLLVCDGRQVFSCESENKEGRLVPTRWKLERDVAPAEGHAAAGTFGNAWHNLIEFDVYPSIGSDPDVKIVVDPAGPDGPAGSVLVDIHREFEGQQFDGNYRRQRYWLDPQRHYAALKSELSECPAADRDPLASPAQKNDIYEFAEYRQSPRGIWYPTLVRRKHCGIDKDEQGTIHYSDHDTQFFLEFTAELPDSLFTPTQRDSTP